MKSIPLNKTWHTLGSVKEFIEENVLDEEVLDYNGWKLVTTRASYGIIDGRLIVRENSKSGVGAIMEESPVKQRKKREVKKRGKT